MIYRNGWNSTFYFYKLCHKTYEKFIYLQQVDKIKTLIPIILDHSILRISNDGEGHIKMCFNRVIQLKIDYVFIFLMI